MKLLSLTVLLLIITGFAGAQNKSQPDPFADVPSSQRDRFKSRLTEFVDYHRAKQWNAVYDLLGDRYKDAAEGGMPRELFLKKKLYSTVRRFTPRSVQKMDSDWWTIWGCATFESGGGVESMFEAYLQNGDWYFSDIWVSTCIDCLPRKCKH